MKLRYIVFFTLLTAAPIHAITLFADGEGGTNGNAGTSFATAHETVSYIWDNYDMEPGDTIVFAKQSGSDIGSPGDNDTGTYNNYIVVMDSLTYSLKSFQRGVTDTTRLWSNQLTDPTNAVSYLMTFDGNEGYIRYIGLDAEKQSGAIVWFANTSGTIEFEQCRFTKRSNINLAGFVNIRSGSNDTLRFINCLFIGNDNVNYALGFFTTGSPYIEFYNCTFSGVFEYACLNFSSSVMAAHINIKNSIVQNTYNAATYGYCLDSGGWDFDDITYSGDYNLWYNAVSIRKFRWESTQITFEAFIDSAQTKGITNEVNSMFQDPVLLRKSTTCIPATKISCENLGYGSQIGWYQYSSIKPVIIIY